MMLENLAQKVWKVLNDAAKDAEALFSSARLPLPGKDLLSEAAATGDLEKLKAIIGDVSSVPAKNTALQSAVEKGHVEAVKLLLDNGADLSANHHEVLLTAASWGRVDIVKILLERGADVSAENYAALNRAIDKGDHETAEAFLAKVEDPSVKNGSLLRASERGHAALVKSIADKVQDPSALAPALSGAARWGHSPVLNILLDRVDDIDAINHALRQAGEFGQAGAAEVLLGKGGHLSAYESGCLVFAAIRGDLKSLEKYLTKVDDSSAKGEALRCAARDGQTDAVTLLLQYGADPSFQHYAALQESALFGCRDCVRALLQRPTPIKDKNLALANAAWGGDTETVKIILERGADIEAVFDLSLNWAQEKGRTETARFLKLADLVVNRAQDRGSCKELFDELGIAYPRSLKSDAFQTPKGAEISNLSFVLLQTARISALLGCGDDALSRGIFKELAENDLKRIEETTGLSYRRYGEFLKLQSEKISNFKDVLTEVAETITYPNLVKEKGQSASMDEARKEASELIASGKTTLDFSSLNNKWHRAGNRVPIDCRPLKRLGEWHALFEPIQTKDGLTVECLKNPSELEEEGKILRHCVGGGGYTSACQEGRSHIVSIREDGVPIATIELGAGSDIKLKNGSSFAVMQFRGAHNSNPPPEAVEAWREAKEMLISGDGVSYSRELGLTDEARRLMKGKLTDVERIAGYPMAESKKYQAKILEHYRTRLSIKRGSSGSGLSVPLIAEDAGSGVGG